MKEENGQKERKANEREKGREITKLLDRLKQRKIKGKIEAVNLKTQ